MGAYDSVIANFTIESLFTRDTCALGVRFTQLRPPCLIPIRQAQSELRSYSTSEWFLPRGLLE